MFRILVPVLALMSAFFAASGATAADAGPQPAATATAYADMEKTSSWSQCSSAACSGGNSTSSYWVAPYQTTPALDGSSTEFSMAGGAYTDDLFWVHPGNNPSASHYILDWNVYTDANAPAVAEALEFDFVQVAAGRKFNFSSECNYAVGTWDTWNEAAMSWVHTSVPCNKFTPNTWHHLRWAYERVGAQTHYISLTVDGVTYPIPPAFAYQPAPPTNWSNGALTFQVQQDLNSSPGSGFKEWVNQATLYAW